jgi:hypothetical protein
MTEPLSQVRSLDQSHSEDGTRVSVLEYLTTMLAEMDRRYTQRAEAQTAMLAEIDRRYEQRYAAQVRAVDAAFLAQQTAMRADLAAQKEAVTKAENAADKRFELLNELRSGVATKEAHEALEKRVNELAARLDKTEGRSTGLNAGWVYLLGAVAAMGTIVSLILAYRM